MREIKFRAWNPIKKSLSPSKPFLEWLKVMDYLKSIAQKDWIFMQYTGLKDNTKWKDLTEEERSKWTRDGNMPSEWNGKEIYEGDWIKFNLLKGDDNEPEYKNEVGGIMVENLGTVTVGNVKYGTFWKWEFVDKDSIEVIGNIYENPELLVK